MKPGWKRSGLIYIFILLAAIALFSFIIPSANKPEEIPLSQAIAMSQNKEIAEIEVEDELLTITTVDDQ